MKKKLLLFVTIILSALMCFSAFADGGEWVQDGNDWKYKKNGSIIKKKWETIDGTTYFFNEDGNMAKGLTRIGAYYYVFGDDGVPHEATGKYEFNGNIYAIGAKGKVIDLEKDFTVEAYEDYKNGITQKAKKEANAAANAQLLANMTANAGTYVNITADQIAVIVKNGAAGIDFMSCGNAVINEIRTQLKEARSKYIQLAKFIANTPNLPTYIAEYQKIEDEYKTLANALLIQIQNNYNPKQETFSKLQEKYNQVFVKNHEDFVEDLTETSERVNELAEAKAEADDE